MVVRVFNPSISEAETVCLQSEFQGCHGDPVSENFKNLKTTTHQSLAWINDRENVGAHFVFLQAQSASFPLFWPGSFC